MKSENFSFFNPKFMESSAQMIIFYTHQNFRISKNPKKYIFDQMNEGKGGEELTDFSQF